MASFRTAHTDHATHWMSQSHVLPIMSAVALTRSQRRYFRQQMDSSCQMPHRVCQLLGADCQCRDWRNYSEHYVLWFDQYFASYSIHDRVTVSRYQYSSTSEESSHWWDQVITRHYYVYLGDRPSLPCTLQRAYAVFSSPRLDFSSWVGAPRAQFLQLSASKACPASCSNLGHWGAWLRLWFYQFCGENRPTCQAFSPLACQFSQPTLDFIIMH